MGARGVAVEDEEDADDDVIKDGPGIVMGCCCCCCCCCCLVRCRPPLPQQIRASHDLGLKFQLSSGRALRGTMGRSAVVVGRHSSVHLVTTAYINSSDDDDEEALTTLSRSGKDFSVIQFPQYLRILYLC